MTREEHERQRLLVLAAEARPDWRDRPIVGIHAQPAPSTPKPEERHA